MIAEKNLKKIEHRLSKYWNEDMLDVDSSNQIAEDCGHLLYNYRKIKESIGKERMVEMTELEKKRLHELENVVRNCYFLLEKGYVDAVKEILKEEEKETSSRYKLLDKEDDNDR